MQRILILRLGSMGDIIHTLPAVATLKRGFPDAEIDWVVEGHWAPLLERNPYLAQLHRLETRSWRRRLAAAGTWRALLGSVSRLRRRGYDCALDFQGLVKSAVVGRLSGAVSVVGFGRAELRERAAALFYTAQASPPADGRAAHVVERNLALAAAVGAKEPVMEFCCTPAPEAVASMRAATAGSAGLPSLSHVPRYAIVSPSAGWAAKRWPEEAYAGLVLRLRRELSLRVVIHCGPGDELIAERVAELAADARPLLLRPSLGELMALVREAALLVAGDTGPLHLAAACGTPVVAVFGPTDPARNGPFSTASRVVRAEDASTTYSRAADRQAIRSVTVEQVFRAADELLQAR